MKICIVAISFPPGIGGIERYLTDLIGKLEEEKIYVEVVAPSFDGQEHTEKSKYVTIHRTPFLNSFDKENIEENGKKFLLYMQKLIKREKIDIISAQNFHKVGTTPVFTLALSMAALNTNTPVMLRVHSFCSSTNTLDECFLRHMPWNKVVCVSNSVKEHVYSKNVNIDKLVTIYPGVDMKKFRPGLGKKWLRSRIKADENDIIILYAGRICSTKRPILEEKGITLLMKAFSILSPHYKNIKLLIAAAQPPPPLKPLFEGTIGQIRELGKLYNINGKLFVQPFSLEEMPFVYNGCDIFAMPSQSETFGLAYAEAMACGLPVIGTNVGGVPEIIDDKKNGFIIANDPIELAQRIELLIKKPDLRKKFGHAGKRKVFDKFSLDRVTRKLLGLWSGISKHHFTLFNLFRQLGLK